MISIIVPVYQAEKYLRQCLDSIQQQTYLDWEAILVDDGSSDGSPAICDEYAKNDGRFKVVHQANSGSSKARDRGLKEAKGDWFAFVDADDFVDKKYLECMLQVAIDNQSDVVLSAYYVNQATTLYYENKPSSLDPKKIILDTLYNKLHAGLWNKLFKSDIFSQITFPPYSYYEDMVVWIKSLYVCKKVAYCPIATYYYRYNPDSLTNKQDASWIDRYYEFCKNFILLDKQYHITQDANLSKAFYFTINMNKRNLVGKYFHHAIKLHKVLRFFSTSYSKDQIKCRGDLFFYLASRYRILFPYYISEWKNKIFAILSKKQIRKKRDVGD